MYALLGRVLVFKFETMNNLYFTVKLLLFFILISPLLSIGQISSFADDFDPDIDIANWSSIDNGAASTNCNAVSGNAFYFNGSGTRQLVTVALNTSNGGWIGFYLKIANGSSPCENADAGDYVVLEYSTDNGTNWVVWQTYAASSYPDFTLLEYTIIPAAQSTSTLFRWRQVSHSGSGYDNWALDDIKFSAIPDDAGVTAIDSPFVFCAGTHDIKATVTNFGTDTLFNVDIDWEFDGISQTTINYNTFIEPVSSGNNTALVTLGNKTFIAGQPHTIKAWTSNPNGIADTTNYNDTALVVRASGLNGTYTIGGTSPDYTDFTSAVSDLNQYGVCGPVTFNVRNGTYNEQITIHEIPGVDSMDTVTFQSESGDSSLAILTFSATSSDNYTVFLDGADWVTFQNLTIEATNTSYGHAVLFGAESHHNSFKNNVLRGVTTTSSSTNIAVISCFNAYADYNVFHDNRIENGAYSIYWDGFFNVSHTLGLEFIRNICEDQYYRSVHIFDLNGPKIEGNIITTNSSYNGYYGVLMDDCNDTTRIVGNQVYGINNGYGIYFSGIDGILTEQALIANNFVQIEGSSNYHGIYSYYGTYQNILYNTVQVLNENASASAFYNQYGSNKVLLNNNFVNKGTGYAGLYQPDLCHYQLGLQQPLFDRYKYGALERRPNHFSRLADSQFF